MIRKILFILCLLNANLSFATAQVESYGVSPNGCTVLVEAQLDDSGNFHITATYSSDSNFRAGAAAVVVNLLSQSGAILYRYRMDGTAVAGAGSDGPLGGPPIVYRQYKQIDPKVAPAIRTLSIDILESNGGDGTLRIFENGKTNNGI